MTSRPSSAGVCVVILLAAAALIPAAALDVTDPGAAQWLELLGADIHSIEDTFGTGHLDITPELLNSRADRIIWYEAGVTFWFSGGAAVQIRVDSSNPFDTAGLRFGSARDEVRAVCGEPWIASPDSLYYNLPWKGGPVRLRFLFTEKELDEIYLYYVR